MDKFVKSTKPDSTAKCKTRHHPYKSHQTLLKEKCTAPRAIVDVYRTASTGHQVSLGAKSRSTTYFASRNVKLASQFNRPTSPLSDSSASTPNNNTDIFRNCCVYINGYMGPLVSDLELKKKLARHGARVVANFGRKSCTHVILGPNGLAGGKIQKEMLARKVGVKYVTVDWALDSIREGKRMVEAKYAIIRNDTQSSMYEILKDKGAASARMEVN